MRILRTPISDVRGAVITIGNFDGVHRGHQALLDRARECSKELARPMMVLTFEPHPAAVLRGPLQGFLLTPGRLKYEYLARYGVESVRVMDFTPAFAAIPAEQFCQMVLHDELAASALIVGYNFTFGHRGLGTVDLLTQWGRQHGVAVEVVPPYREAGSHTVVSSSGIRTLIRDGRLGEAQRWLGHPFTVQGTVMPGDQRGRGLGVPTLNVAWPVEQVAPPYGVYAGYARWGGSDQPAVASFGVRPTFGGGDARLEIHALDGEIGDLYGQTVVFDLLYRIREERSYPSTDALVRAMHQDIEEARRLLKGHG